MPFAIGADSIAQAAFVWCKTLDDLGDLSGKIDVGLEKLDAARVVTFETYPAAFVRNVAPRYTDYKSIPEQRAALLRELAATDYRISCPDSDDARPINDHPWCRWAVQQRGSPDAFDALLCACTAWDHLRSRTGRREPAPWPCGVLSFAMTTKPGRWASSSDRSSALGVSEVRTWACCASLLPT